MNDAMKKSQNNESRLPWRCPDHPDAKIRHEWDETTYLRCGGYPMGKPIKGNHRYFCNECGRELAASPEEAQG